VTSARSSDQSDSGAVLNAVRGVAPSFDVMGIASDGRVALETTLRLTRQRSRAKIVFLTVSRRGHPGSLSSRSWLGYVAKVFMDTDQLPAINEALAGHVFTSRFSSEQDQA